MIVSSDSSCPHYSPLLLGRVVITLDGVVVKRCRFADDVAGRVIVCPVDERGLLLVDGMKIRTQELRGTVEIQVMS